MTTYSDDSVGSVPAQAGRPDHLDVTADAASAASPPLRRTVKRRPGWRRWRRTRPFWGGVFVIIGAVEILLSMRAPMSVIVHMGLQGLSGYIIPVVLLCTGLLLLFHPQQRLFYSIVAIVLALATWLTSNLGGFFIGMLCGLIGGSLAFAWSPRGRRTRVTAEPPDGIAPAEAPAAGDYLPQQQVPEDDVRERPTAT